MKPLRAGAVDGRPGGHGRTPILVSALLISN